MQEVIGPIALEQKSKFLCCCMRCKSLFLPVMSNDGSLYGGHYSGFGQAPFGDDGNYVCDKCWGVRRIKEKPKEKIGFRT